jgi:hypothetical protein
MNGIRTMLSERVESLLPRTTAAAACLPPSRWSSFRFHGCCSSFRSCHISCHGNTECAAWTVTCICPG